jgi:hypothetical protein
VVACDGKSTIGISEHPTEGSPGSQRCDIRSVVDHTVLSEEFDYLVVEPVIDAVRIAMNEIDYLVLGDQPSNGGSVVTFHRFSWARRFTGVQARTTVSSSRS